MIFQPNMNFSVQKGAGCQYDLMAPKFNSRLGSHPRDSVSFYQDIVCRLLEKPEVLLRLKPTSYRFSVENAVRLCPGRADCRALGAIENAKLNPRLVRGNRHRAAQGVDFLHQMTLTNAPNGRITRHLSEGFQAMGQQKRGAAHPSGSKGCLGACMAAADHNDVKIFRKNHCFT
jgi:hypothetical protein